VNFFPIILLLAVGAVSSPALALDPADSSNKQVVYVDLYAASSFALEDALLFVETEKNSITLAQAIVVPPQGDESKRHSTGDWFIGSRVGIAGGVREIQVSAILIGADDQYASIPPTVLQLDKEHTFDNSSDTLRTHIEERKGVLKSWDVQVDAQRDSLRRLRADAEVIADVNKILEAKEEIERSKPEMESLERDIRSLKEALKEVKTLPSPKNFAKREVELTQQLSELANIARAAESGELERRSLSEVELQRRLQVVEENRFEDVETLQQIYQRLLDRLQRLEGPAAGTSPNQAPSM